MNIPFLSLKDVTAKYADEIHEAVLRVVDSGWYLQGKENEQFEKHYAEYIGTKHCIGCANGLDALIWIFRAYIEMGVMQPGDEVIVPANTYIATILAITENGLVPVLVEPHKDTLQIDDSLIEERITNKTKAICIVHLYGRLAYTEKIGELCKKYNLKLVEDNAQAHGCKTNLPSLQGGAGGRLTGSLGDAAGHSFYPGKNLGALGDGGAVTTDDDELAAAIRALANYGSQKKYVFKYTGRNSRLDEIQAAVLDVKLRHLDEDLKARQAIAAYYYDNINNPLITLPKRLPDSENVYHLFPILVKPTPNPFLEEGEHASFAQAWGAHTADSTQYNLLKENAKANRKNPTEAESVLWDMLKGNNIGYHFRRQHIILDYIVDFICLEKGLIIELDGGYHNDPQQKEYDELRTAHLQRLGYTELRFKNEELLCDPDAVLEKIKYSLDTLPSLQGRAGDRLLTLPSREESEVGLCRDRLQAYLEENGVGTVIHYPIPPHLQECYQNHPSFQGRAGDRLVLPITEMLADCELSLPMSPCMTLEQAEYVVNLINNWEG